MNCGGEKMQVLLLVFISITLMSLFLLKKICILLYVGRCPLSCHALKAMEEENNGIASSTLFITNLLKNIKNHISFRQWKLPLTCISNKTCQMCPPLWTFHSCHRATPLPAERPPLGIVLKYLAKGPFGKKFLGQLPKVQDQMVPFALLVYLLPLFKTVVLLTFPLCQLTLLGVLQGSMS